MMGSRRKKEEEKVERKGVDGMMITGLYENEKEGGNKRLTISTVFLNVG